MPVTFTLDQKIIGYAASTAAPGDPVQVRYRELIGPGDPLHLQRQLENLHGSLFCKIPGFPTPSVVDHLLLVIRPDLQCTAYFNELNILMHARTTRTVEKGAPVYFGDIADVTSVDLGVPIPDDCGVVLVRSANWKRSLFFDFGPLSPDVGKRTYAIEQVCAQQALLLLGLPSGVPDEPSPSSDAPASETPKTRLATMVDGLSRLRSLLSSTCEDESQYQELLQKHPWMLGGVYSAVIRHQKLDDANIPDFTAIRCYDNCHDIIELKQPFLPLFKRGGEYTADFHAAWSQAERYLSFAMEQRTYLRDEKGLVFESPRCVLVVGRGLSESQLRKIRKKETFVRSISILTYDHLVEVASNLIGLVTTANKMAVGDGRPLSDVAIQVTGVLPPTDVGDR